MVIVIHNNYSLQVMDCYRLHQPRTSFRYGIKIVVMTHVLTVTGAHVGAPPQRGRVSTRRPGDGVGLEDAGGWTVRSVDDTRGRRRLGPNGSGEG